MPQIFISYRRVEGGYVAADLSDKLQQHFGENSVFFDVDDIPLGVDFREHIANAVGQCDVLLAIIGDQWVSSVDEHGNRRLDNPSDFVRIEIESALKRQIPVIPVLVGRVQMPSADDLPESLKSIAYRNATELRAGRDLRQHFDLLIKGLESLFGIKKPSDEKATSQKDPVDDSKQAKAGASSNLVEAIEKSLDEYTDKNLFVGTIPPKKLNNAIATYAPKVSPEDVLLLYDDTVFGSAKEGLLLTADAVYWRRDGEPERLRFAEIRKVGCLKYSLSAAIVLNEKEIQITQADNLTKCTESLANVIRGLAKR